MNMLKHFELKELKQDNRGEICLLRFGNSEPKLEAFLSHTKTSVSRSGYYFKPNKIIGDMPPRIYLVLNGRFLYRNKDIKTGEETEKEIKTGDYIYLEPNHAHMFTALEDSDMIEFTPGSTEKEEMIPYPPYRELVEKSVMK